MYNEIKSMVSQNMKTKTMINREKRIEKYKNDIENIKEKINNEEEILEEEYNKIINKELLSIEEAFSKRNIDMKLDDLVEIIKNGNIGINNYNKNS